MTTGELLTRWTIRLALVLYAAALGTLLVSRGRASWDRRARWLWTFGWAVFMSHMAAAFQFYHHWSHTAAWHHTARDTAAVVGWNWGGGVWINYAFALAWTADALWWWLAGLRGYRARPVGLVWMIQSFLAFVAFNATVVFETGPTRWCGLVIALVLAGLAWRELRS
jgi:hypothetical protein